jgi:hypothetical protein
MQTKGEGIIFLRSVIKVYGLELIKNDNLRFSIQEVNNLHSVVKSFVYNNSNIINQFDF